MPRRQHPEPFWRRQTQCYYVQIGKRQHRLSSDREEAFRVYHELMSRPPDAPPPPIPANARRVVEIIDLFLEWCLKNTAKRTYEWYVSNLQIFAESIPPTLTIADLKPYHVTSVMDAYAGRWSNNTKNDFATAVQRAFNWAQQEGFIDLAPLARVRKPSREGREMAITPAQYRQIIKAVKEPNFRDLIELAWETGARVQELRKIEARFVDSRRPRIVFPPRESKGKKHHRVIYLGTDRAREIVARLCADRPEGPILRNSDGKPWVKDAINCAFCRLEKKLGVKYHLGAFRKGYSTEGLKNGVDTITMANLLGHSNGAMLSRIYAKVQQDPAFMAESAKKAKGG